MNRTLACDCGFIAQAHDDVGLAKEVRRHAWEAHRMPLSNDEALLILFHAQLAGVTSISWRPLETEEQ